MFRYSQKLLAICGALAIGVVAALPARALAEENATLVLRSGDRVTGQLMDHSGVGFTIRVNGQERQIPTNDVAVIDFGAGDMTAADWARFNAGTHLVWLKNGQTVQGQFVDIGGSNPLRITIKTDAGDRDFPSSEIGRIVLARPNNAVATSGASTIPGGEGIAVPGNQAWTPTGITVRRGDVLTIRTTGEVQLSNDPQDIADAGGSRSQRFAQNAPFPRSYAGALIARVGNGAPFPIGTDTTVTMPANGQLFLGINDDAVGDNQGGFRVEVRRSNRR